MKEYLVNNIIYIETNDKAMIGDFVVSSEQIGQSRVYEVYNTTNTKLVLGRYCLGHCSLSNYKTLKPKQ